jgi:hypothetical protein
MKAARLSNQILFDYIFVSPLRRSMETAHEMFKDHPNFENIQFIIHPMLRENIMTAGDIPGNIGEIIDEFSYKFPNLCTRYFSRDNVGELETQYYARDFRPDLSEKVEGLSKYELDLVLCDDISQTFPKSIEKMSYTNGRVQLMKQFMRDFIQNDHLETVTSEGKIGIVGHSYFFKLWTGLWYDEQLMYRKQPKEYVWLENCELFPDVFNFPTQHKRSSIIEEFPIDRPKF